MWRAWARRLRRVSLIFASFAVCVSRGEHWVFDKPSEFSVYGIGMIRWRWQEPLQQSEEMVHSVSHVVGFRILWADLVWADAVVVVVFPFHVEHIIFIRSPWGVILDDNSNKTFYIRTYHWPSMQYCLKPFRQSVPSGTSRPALPPGTM